MTASICKSRLVFVLTVLFCGLANTAAGTTQTLSFDFIPSTSLYGQETLTFTSGDYILTVSAMSHGQDAQIAKQEVFGLGVRLDASEGASWSLTTGEALVFSLADNTGPVSFSNIGFQPAFSNHFSSDERASISINGNAYNLQGAPRGVSNADAPLIDSANAIGQGWASAQASSFTLTAEDAASGASSQFRVIGLSVDIIDTPAILESRWISQMIDGQMVQREYFIRYPAVQNQINYPLVIFFHGAGGNGLDILNPEAENLIDQDEFIGVFPSGFQNRWNVDGETAADDVEFVQLMLDELALDARFDIARVYGIGRSNGAGMVNKLAKETALFKGVAPIASQQLVLLGNMVPLRPVSIFQVNGDNDTVIPLEGGLVFGSKLFLSAQASAENWAASFSCAQSPTVDTLNWGDATVQSYLYAECLEGREVRYLIVEGVGHSMVIGGGFSLYSAIWSFFKTQQAEPIAYTEVPILSGEGFLIMAASLVLLVRLQQLSKSAT